METMTDNWKMKTLIIGAIIGLLSGLVAAYILVQRAEDEQNRPRMSAGDSVKVGLGVLGVLRQVSDLTTKH